MSALSSSEIRQLEKKHAQLLKEAFQLSKSNRQLSDQKYAEAHEIERKLDNAK